MPSKLSIYNGALRMLGERKLSALTESREPRRLLDDVWDDDGVKRCLQQGQWNFAMRTVQIDYSPSVEPDFGYQRAFDKPSDCVRVCGVCSDEYFRNSLVDYNDEASFWFADIDVIYVRYVSDDEEYGLDLANWPANFTAFVEGWFAFQIAPGITGSKISKADVDKLLNEARTTDSMEEPPGLQPTGSWTRARHGSRRADKVRGGTLY